MIYGFWTLSHPLGCIAKSLIVGDRRQALIKAINLQAKHSEAREEWNTADKRVLNEIYAFEVYIATRKQIELPTPECMPLWVAHSATQAIKRNDALCYHALHKLIDLLMEEGNEQTVL